MEDLIQNLKLFKPDRDFIERNESVRTLVLRVYRKSQSNASVNTYVANLRKFFAWLGMEPDEAKNAEINWENKINAFIDECVSKSLSPKRIHSLVSAVKRWGVVNEVNIAWGKVELPGVWKTTEERIPTKEELREIMKVGDLTDKIMVACLVSSGLRVGALIRLQLKDVDFDYECPLVKVSPRASKARQGYLTFFSPEAKSLIKSYLEDRKNKGEQITGESFLLVRERPLGLPISVPAAEERWLNLLRRAGKKVKKGRRHIVRLHSLRKYFKSWCSLSGVQESVTELFMGHRHGISQVYFLPDVEAASSPEVVSRLLTEYKKALPALTIFSEEEKIKELEGKVEEQKRILEEEKRKHEEEKRRLEEERKFLEERVKRLEALVDEVIRARREIILKAN
ncbi:MAG: site-specific integrase [Candidatus Methanomethyliaceae archaeon]|nr:site-specific integrase [Candidatus Methanomethyliaceae archaeon]